MKKNETNEILKRIKSNYQDFIVDEYKQNEWYKELKEYDYEDVVKKLEEHLRSEQYGSYAPKLYFLTKYLKTTVEKNTKTNFNLQCKLCGEYFCENEYDNHYDRCSDINYITKIRKKYFNKIINEDMKKKYYELSDEQFQTKFMIFLNDVYNNLPKEEQNIIDKIINPPKNKKLDLGID